MSEKQKGFVDQSVISGIESNVLLESVDKRTKDLDSKLQELKNQGSDLSVASSMEFQLLSNKLMQLCEMSNSVFSSFHQAIISMLRAIRS